MTQNWKKPFIMGTRQMHDQAATLDPSSGTNRQTALHSADNGLHNKEAGLHGADAARGSRGQKMKFTYTSGSSPLEGYTIKRGVGAGGFGEVYYATSEGGKEVALKHIQRHLDIEMRGVRQCLNLKHPNLVSLYDIKYDESGEGWVVMEYVSGESLQDAIESNPNGMPLKEVLHWFRPLAAGVGYLHDHGIVHRDLKPGNIFSDADIIKIGDYGLSKFISVSRRSGQTESVGTFHYMAPEIGRGNYGREIDIYALGIILCEMLTGRVPFEGESGQEIMMKHLMADPDLTGIEEPYYSAIEACLVKDPDHRIHTAEELLQRIGITNEDSHILPQHFTTGEQSPQLSEADLVAKKNSRVNQHGVNGNHAVPVDHPANDFVAPLAIPHAELNSGQDEEPIAKAVGGFFESFSTWWNNDNTSMFPKIIVLVLLGMFFVLNSAWLLPLSFVLGGAYCAYLLIRTVAIQTGSRSTVDSRKNTTVAEQKQYHPTAMARKNKVKEPRTKKPSRMELDRKVLAKKPLIDSATELTGSLLMSAIVAIVLSIVLLPVAKISYEGSVTTWGPWLAWMTIVVTSGSWMILIVSKKLESSEGEAVFHRFWMLGLGLILGAIALASSSLLSEHLAITPDHRIRALNNYFEELSTPDGQLTVGSFLVYFAGLFLVLRWWKLADPLRTTRLSIWATIVCVLWAVVLNAVWPFAQPWGVMMAGSIAIAVQLSAPWVSPRLRDERRKRMLLADTKTSAPYDE
ncbi:MAG: hypothetical protein COA78_01800 [Blastopirellula sp.]|nr:MAG: hypothetical protein COA78_01800 [Blastopirellula sp.]